MTDFTAQTPSQIDEQISRIESEMARVEAQVKQMYSLAVHYNKRGDLTAEADTMAKMTEMGGKLDSLHMELAPFTVEYARRGGWTRAYLVNNSNGHVHRSTACGTCFPDTQFVWLTDYSGMDEQTIVSDAGERACTVCYASAPVELHLDRKTMIFTPDEIAAQAVRETRESKKAKAAEGNVLDSQTGKLLFKTVRGATNQIASNMDAMVHYGPTHPSFNEWKNENARIIMALVVKGEIDDALAYEHEALIKARKKVTREHKTFMASAQRKQWEAQGMLDPATLADDYNPCKY